MFVRRTAAATVFGNHSEMPTRVNSKAFQSLIQWYTSIISFSLFFLALQSTVARARARHNRITAKICFLVWSEHLHTRAWVYVCVNASTLVFMRVRLANFSHSFSTERWINILKEWKRARIFFPNERVNDNWTGAAFRHEMLFAIFFVVVILVLASRAHAACRQPPYQPKLNSTLTQKRQFILLFFLSFFLILCVGLPSLSVMGKVDGNRLVV